MSSKIKSFYVRLLQMIGALYVGGFVGSIVEQVLKCAHLNKSFPTREIWSDLMHIPFILLTALFQKFSLPEKLIWTVLYVICGAYVFRSKNNKWLPALVGILACLWVFYEASNSYFF